MPAYPTLGAKHALAYHTQGQTTLPYLLDDLRALRGIKRSEAQVEWGRSPTLYLDVRMHQDM